MPPWQGGRDRFLSVSFPEPTTYLHVPHRFEAGTTDIAAVVGMGAAIDWFWSVGLDRGTADEKSAVIGGGALRNRRNESRVVGDPHDGRRARLL